MDANKDIEVGGLKEKMESGETFILIDVREDFEHRQFNLGGELIPLEKLINEMDDLDYGKEDEILVYCLSGKRSHTAKVLMNQAGFTNVRNVLGGVLSWLDRYGPGN